MGEKKTLRRKWEILTESKAWLFTIQIAAMAVVSAGCFFMLEYSMGHSIFHTVSRVLAFEIRYTMLNILTVAVVLIVLAVLFGRTWLACLVSPVLFSGIAIANHYVMMFHGMPLSFTMVKNFQTAMNVAGAYRFEVDLVVRRELIMLAMLVLFSILVRMLTNRHRLKGWTRLLFSLTLAACSVSVIYFAYFSDTPMKPKKTITWDWKGTYDTYGFVASSVESITLALHPVVEPDGYTVETVENMELAAEAGRADAEPDIVLILNESFYDPAVIAEFTTDVPYLEHISTMENTLRGYAVVPGKGGGTNNSEYELLTSNSLKLMPGITPFNSLDLYNANSIVSHLSWLGYATLGAHSEPATNYSRAQAYPALGFDKIYFDEEFLGKEYYGDERWFETDSSLYKNLFRWYEEMPSEQPRFQYLLTIQNHGAWDTNDASYDTVHAVGNFGDRQQSINEFLSCIRLSDEAFSELTDYYATVDRPVIVCMLGDHGPNFAADINHKAKDAAEANLLLRKVPLIIWANFDLPETEIGTISMNYVVPTLLDIAGVRRSSYYDYMLQMKKNVPILTVYGDYYDTEGNRYTYDGDTNAAYEQMVDNYFYLEYNNLNRTRKQEIFLPYE